MDDSLLHPIVERLARARVTADVSGIAIDGIRAAFGARSGGALFFDGNMVPVERTLTGIRESDHDEYELHWRPIDRVFAAVTGHCAPTRATDVYPVDSLVRQPIYTQYGRRVDIFHYMSAPLFGSHGRLAGVVNFARPVRDRPFTVAELHLAGIFAGFLSATMARVRAEHERMPPPDGVRDGARDGARDGVRDGVRDDLLTERERQVACLAASGCNNLEIAQQLGIARETVKQALKRVYRKLSVKGRAEMATRLALSGVLGR